ncbi:CAP domain-containing protein [Flavisphingomonas formosensis]|uniref:CAP domain-containing protein n=1 Tax=Flavisphingomonas formosensis TaxID=861534 RepID=UPI0012FA2A9F|nr:CAP domain-containing protein [Sphingomonas formosensis]
MGRRFSVLLALWPIFGAASPAQAADQLVQQPWTDTRPQPRGPALLRQSMLAAHNAARAAAGVPPLAWSEALARDAAAYAVQLARERRFAHSPVPRGTPSQGENLWMGTRTAYSYDEMIGGWIGERRLFKPGRFPKVSRNSDWTAVGHYTQIVWRTTTAVGCGTAANATDDYLVCRYLPSGNVVGRDPLTGMP